MSTLKGLGILMQYVKSRLFGHAWELGLMLLITFSCMAASAATPAPTRDEVMAMLDAANYKDIVIGHVVQGSGIVNSTPVTISANGALAGHYYSENVALIRAIGRRGGKQEEIIWTIWFDPAIGWHYIEVKDDSKIRLWTKSGYKELSLPPPK